MRDGTLDWNSGVSWDGSQGSFSDCLINISEAPRVDNNDQTAEKTPGVCFWHPALVRGSTS